jgi:predicted phosphodiesterase
MKIIVFGDVHENIEIIDKVIDEQKPDFALCTGDLGLYKSYNVPFYFVSGNHENFDIIKAMDKGIIEFKNLRRIKTAEVIALDSIKVSGLNGNYSPNYKIRERHFTKDDVKACKKLKDIDIFISHEAPSEIGVLRMEKDLGIKPVKEILDKIKPKYFFFGHHHCFFRKFYKDTKIIGLGYAKDSFISLLINKGEFEENLIKIIK